MRLPVAFSYTENRLARYRIRELPKCLSEKILNQMSRL